MRAHCTETKQNSGGIANKNPKKKKKRARPLALALSFFLFPCQQEGKGTRTHVKNQANNRENKALLLEACGVNVNGWLDECFAGFSAMKRKRGRENTRGQLGKKERQERTTTENCAETFVKCPDPSKARFSSNNNNNNNNNSNSNTARMKATSNKPARSSRRRGLRTRKKKNQCL